MVRAGSPPPPPPPPPPDGALLLPPPPSFFLPNQFIDNALLVLLLLDVAESVEDTLPPNQVLISTVSSQHESTSKTGRVEFRGLSPFLSSGENPIMQEFLAIIRVEVSCHDNPTVVLDTTSPDE